MSENHLWQRLISCLFFVIFFFLSIYDCLLDVVSLASHRYHNLMTNPDRRTSKQEPIIGNTSKYINWKSLHGDPLCIFFYSICTLITRVRVGIKNNKW